MNGLDRALLVAVAVAFSLWLAAGVGLLLVADTAHAADCEGDYTACVDWARAEHRAELWGCKAEVVDALAVCESDYAGGLMICDGSDLAVCQGEAKAEQLACRADARVAYEECKRGAAPTLLAVCADLQGQCQ